MVVFTRSAWRVLLLAGLLSVHLRAEIVLVPRTLVTRPTGVFEVVAFQTNEGHNPEALALSDELMGWVHSGTQRSVEVVLKGNEVKPAESLAAGTFARRTYSFVMPENVSGPVVLEVRLAGVRPLMFSVQNEVTTELANTGPDTTIGRAEELRHQRALRKSTRLLPGLAEHEPVYLALGGSAGLNAKFQVSLRYNPFDLWPVYVGYTQTSLWDLHSRSKPFYDTAYRPSLFHEAESLWVSADGRFKLSSQGGFEHESNGRGGLDSRSINTLFVRPRLEWRQENSTKFYISSKLYGYLEKSENPDMPDYRGYCDLQLGYVWHEWKLSTTVRKGMKGSHGSLEVNAVMPLRSTDTILSTVGVHGINGYLFFQYFNGWGESILDYNHKLHSQFRAGVLLVP